MDSYKIISCPQCNKNIKLISTGDTSSYICPHCGRQEFSGLYSFKGAGVIKCGSFLMPLREIPPFEIQKEIVAKSIENPDINFNLYYDDIGVIYISGMQSDDI